jgi:omega-6 fatty acid desaturase (delta-12 desaturase)
MPPYSSVQEKEKNLKIRNGRDLILATKPFAVDDPSKSWWVILSSIFLWLAAAVVTLCNISFAPKLVLSCVMGLLIVRLFVIYHDLQHHALLPNSKLAAICKRFLGIVLLSPNSIWKSSHDHHHKHNSKMRGSQIGSFPIMTKENYLNSSSKIRRRYLLMRHPVTILFGYLSVFLFGMCVGPFFTKGREHSDCLVALLIHLGIGAALIGIFGWEAWLLVQVIPHFIAYALGAYLFYAQHNFPEVEMLDQSGWSYEKAAMESSSYMKMGPVMAWFTGNIGYHHIHHLNARIPFYRLPEVWRAMPELQKPKTTSLSPRDIMKCLHLKVWDAKAQRMVGL